MSLQSWVNIVVVKMIGIDRAAKHVIVTGGTKVPYEHLILCTGQQFQVSLSTHEAKYVGMIDYWLWFILI